MNEDLFYSVNIDQIAKTTAVDQINTDFKYIQKTMEKGKASNILYSDILILWRASQTM